MAKVLKKLRMMVENGSKADGEKIYKEEEVKLNWSVIHGAPSWAEISGKPSANQYPNTAEYLGANANLNNYQTPGYYYQSSNVNTSSALNYPVNLAGTLVVTKDVGVTQMYYEYNRGGVWYRTYYGGTWKSWVNLLTPSWGSVTGKPEQATRWPAWSEVAGKPTTFAPSSHTHAWSEITSKPTAFDPTLNKVYPVGAVYLSVTSTNPGTLFGGTWVAFGTGRTLVGIDASQTEFNTVEKTGGHKSLQAHTHTVSGTAASSGSHTHTVLSWSGKSGTVLQAYPGGPNVRFSNVFTTGDGQHNNAANTLERDGVHTHDVSGTAASTGGGNAQNLQPYITVYMWKRTA